MKIILNVIINLYWKSHKLTKEILVLTFLTVSRRPVDEAIDFRVCRIAGRLREKCNILELLVSLCIICARRRS